MPAVKQRYVITCFKGGNHKVGKVIIYAYREIGSWDYYSSKKINFLEDNALGIIKRVVKDASSCDYVLVKNYDGRNELLIPSNPSAVKGCNLYPKLAKLTSISVLWRQEAPGIEENVVFSKTLVKEEFPVRRSLYIFEGEVKLPENAVGVKITTDLGERILLRSELPIPPSTGKKGIKSLSKKREVSKGRK